MFKLGESGGQNGSRVNLNRGSEVRWSLGLLPRGPGIKKTSGASVLGVEGLQAPTSRLESGKGDSAVLRIGIGRFPGLSPGEQESREARSLRVRPFFLFIPSLHQSGEGALE